MEDLNKLLPGREVTAGGEVITLRPFTFGQLPKVIGVLSRMGGDLFGLIQNITVDEQGEVVINNVLLMTVASVCEQHWDDVTSLVCMGTGKSAEWVNNLNGAEGIDLLVAIIQDNWSFFKERLNQITSETQEKAKESKKKQA